MYTTNEIPERLKGRSIQYNAPFTSILFNPIFETMYSTFLKENNFSIYSAILQESEPYHSQDYTLPTAIVVGTEATGLTEIWREAATQSVNIPMQGQIDSMNVSVSAAIILFEAKRHLETLEYLCQCEWEIIHNLNKPHKKNEILYACVSISYYEHLEGDGSSFSLRKRMMVSFIFRNNIFRGFYNNPNLNLISSIIRLMFNFNEKYIKERLQDELLEENFS